MHSVGRRRLPFLKTLARTLHVWDGNTVRNIRFVHWQVLSQDESFYKCTVDVQSGFIVSSKYFLISPFFHMAWAFITLGTCELQNHIMIWYDITQKVVAQSLEIIPGSFTEFPTWRHVCSFFMQDHTWSISRWKLLAYKRYTNVIGIECSSLWLTPKCCYKSFRLNVFSVQVVLCNFIEKRMPARVYHQERYWGMVRSRGEDGYFCWGSSTSHGSMYIYIDDSNIV